MIVGVGSDLVDIRRIARTLERFGDRFVRRVFTEAERQKADRRPASGNNSRAATYARRYAAKEACAKALGTGLGQGVGWKDIGVVNLPSGQPTLVLSGQAKKRLQELVPQPMVPVVSLTLTDEFPVAQAVVIISSMTGKMSE
ncbi:MAG: holo-ACP synthase [Pseudomonadota bacterium]|nr:holo-ACP synthase [Pseudomonadota bacterium]